MIHFLDNFSFLNLIFNLLQKKQVGAADKLQFLPPLTLIKIITQIFIYYALRTASISP